MLLLLLLLLLVLLLLLLFISIIIKNKNNDEHLKNLDQILKVIRDNGFRLKLKKCMFMQPDVARLEFKVNKNGIFPSK